MLPLLTSIGCLKVGNAREHVAQLCSVWPTLWTAGCPWLPLAQPLPRSSSAVLRLLPTPACRRMLTLRRTRWAALPNGQTCKAHLGREGCWALRVEAGHYGIRGSLLVTPGPSLAPQNCRDSKVGPRGAAGDKGEREDIAAAGRPGAPWWSRLRLQRIREQRGESEPLAGRGGVRRG